VPNSPIDVSVQVDIVCCRIGGYWRLMAATTQMNMPASFPCAEVPVVVQQRRNAERKEDDRLHFAT